MSAALLVAKLPRTMRLATASVVDTMALFRFLQNVLLSLVA